jgi:hypothetical protein
MHLIFKYENFKRTPRGEDLELNIAPLPLPQVGNSRRTTPPFILRKTPTQLIALMDGEMVK